MWPSQLLGFERNNLSHLLTKLKEKGKKNWISMIAIGLTGINRIAPNLNKKFLFDDAVTAVDSPNKALELLGLKGDNGNGNELVMKVNMIITDYSMPGMTGYDLLRKIKESERLRDIPVVIMSSENIPSRISRCLADGAEEFFLKPVQLSDVDKLKPHLLRGKAKDFCKFQQRLLNWYPDAGKLFHSCV